MDSTNAERFYDHSTIGGKLKRILGIINNWLWLIVPLTVVVTLVLLFAILPRSDDLFYDTTPTPDPSSRDSTPLLFHGTQQLVTATPVLFQTSGRRTGPSLATAVPVLFKQSGRTGPRLATATPLLFKKPSTKPTGRSTVVPNECPPTPAPVPGEATNLRNGTFLFEPNAHQDLLLNYSGLYAGLTEIDKAYLRKLVVIKLLVDAPLLSERIQDSPALETILFDQIGVSGNFSRVLLPSLQEFTYNQHRNAPTDAYKNPSTLKSLLFFNLVSGQDWDLERDLLNLGVKVKVSLGGTTVVEVDRAAGLVILNVLDCEAIYKNLKVGPEEQPVTRLSLSWCPVRDPALLPLSTLKYLSLNNAVPERALLDQILQGATQLEEFHAFLPYACDNASYISPEIPEIMIFVNLTEFSRTIRRVSLSKLAIYALPETYVSPIQSLVLETANVTGILPNFGKNFQNLSRLAVFNSSTVDDGYRILEEALKTNAEWILLQDFERNASYTEVEAFLAKLNIVEAERNFLIQKEGPGGNYTGRAVSDFEKHYNRYNLLAFNDTNSYGDYTVYDAVYE